MEKKDFTIGSLWRRSVDGVDPCYFLVIKIRSLDVQFAGLFFGYEKEVGTYFFNWKEILSTETRVKWEKVS